MTDQKRLLLGSYGGPAVADGARCMGIPETQYVINQLTVERSCTRLISGANERITGPGATSENGEVG